MYVRVKMSIAQINSLLYSAYSETISLQTQFCVAAGSVIQEMPLLKSYFKFESWLISLHIRSIPSMIRTLVRLT